MSKCEHMICPKEVCFFEEEVDEGELPETLSEGVTLDLDVHELLLALANGKSIKDIQKETGVSIGDMRICLRALVERAAQEGV